jgi:ribosomal protein L37E
MTPNSYNVQIGDEVLRHIEMVSAAKAPSRKVPEIVAPPHRRSKGMLALDCLLAFLILSLPASFIQSTALFIAHLAAVLAIVLAGYCKLVWLIFEALGPPDTPHIIAIIKAPDRVFCPRCGEPRTKKYCSICGVNTEKEYRKLVRQLAYYAVEETKEERLFLEASIKQHLEGVVQEQQQQIVLALEKMERQYVMEIARQHKALRGYQYALMPPVPPDAEIE